MTIHLATSPNYFTIPTEGEVMNYETWKLILDFLKVPLSVFLGVVSFVFTESYVKAIVGLREELGRLVAFYSRETPILYSSPDVGGKFNEDVYARILEARAFLLRQRGEIAAKAVQIPRWLYNVAAFFRLLPSIADLRQIHIKTTFIANALIPVEGYDTRIYDLTGAVIEIKKLLKYQEVFQELSEVSEDEEEDLEEADEEPYEGPQAESRQ